jgi:hypothetical protein
VFEVFWCGETLLCLFSIMLLLSLPRGSTIVTSFSCVKNEVNRWLKAHNSSNPLVILTKKWCTWCCVQTCLTIVLRQKGRQGSLVVRGEGSQVA